MLHQIHNTLYDTIQNCGYALGQLQLTTMPFLINITAGYPGTAGGVT